MKIKVNESSVVRPMAATPSTSLWISNLDSLMPTDYHTHTTYFYRSNGAADFFDSAVLKATLGRALVTFYPVAGRFKMANGRMEINCNGEGVLFVEAEADGNMDELGDFDPRPDLALTPPVDYSRGISTYPLLLLQVTHFKCGGVCLGVAFEHHLSDGTSALHFINTWSDIARGHGVTIPPFFDRTVLSARNPPQPKFTHNEYQPPPTIKSPPPNDASPDALVFKRFNLTRDQINHLKAKCKENDGNVGANYSTYEVVAGHTWRCIFEARGLPHDQETKMYIGVDGRSRLRPSLPPGYYGNVIFTAAPIATVGELQSNPLKHCVRKIREAIAQMDDDYVRSALDYLELQLGQRSPARGSNAFKCPNIGVISWTRLPFYDADFGWGRPVYVGPGEVPYEGKILLMPSPTNDGSIFHAISLPKEQMERFEKLFSDI